MDVFDPKKDINCTPDGYAQDRIPPNLELLATQKGTVLGADMANGINSEQDNLHETFQIFHDQNQKNQLAIVGNPKESFGIPHEENQYNNLAIGFNQSTVYNYVGKLRRWVISKENIPKTDAVLDGSLLKSEDFEDALAKLKQRCPSWISGENIQLPNLNGYFSRSDSSRTLGGKQSNAMRKVEIDVYSTLTNPEMDEITIPGAIDGKVGKAVQTPAGHARLGSVLNPYDWKGSSTIDLVQTDPQEVKLPTNFTIDVSSRLTQDGTVANENRPQNVAFLVTVIVGIPKKKGAK